MPQPQLGRYEITATLGRGAMGVVYKAHDPLIERIVAIKTVAFAGISETEAEEFEQRFFREAKSAGRLNHPNIVTIHDVGRSNGLAYIAMEFLSGQSLRALLNSGAPLTFERIIEIVSAIADGLAFAHAQGIVHRDIKPANIMVLENGVVKITDFGIAQLPGGSLTMTGTVLGSPKYMAPEQVAGQKADGRADIFSLGTVLYEMLTGQPPFSCDNLHATIYQVVIKTPPPPSSCCPGLPADFDAIVARAMAKDRSDRYQDASEMAADLRRMLRSGSATLSGEASGQIAVTQPANDAGAAAIPDQQRQNSSRLRLGAIAVTLILLTLAATVFLLRSPSPSPSPSPTMTPVADQTSNLPTPPEPYLAKQQPAEHKSAAATTPTDSASAPKTRRDTPPSVKAVPARSWKDALNADLKACREESVFSRIVCIEKARWKHCPGHWGTIDDCPSNMAGQKAP
ncbi:MAG: serine/threonine protein kinase [Propionivibrio sp.]|nr:serine/threonine protein kinase [Propionivibrio sp.]